MKDKKEKTLWFIMNVMVCIILLMAFIFIWMVGGMLDDHECWIDGYQSEHCQKYVGGNE